MNQPQTYEHQVLLYLFYLIHNGGGLIQRGGHNIVQIHNNVIWD